jgi:hypothetical protein
VKVIGSGLISGAMLSYTRVGAEESQMEPQDCRASG